jgi:hypothetical protein
MKRTWTLRDAAYEAFSQWPKLVLLFVVGAAVGWGVGQLVPPNYRAIAHIYVGFNPYKVYEDSRFEARANPRYSDIDDYKNYQMSQLDELMNRDETLNATLAKLRQQDSQWEKVDINQLRAMLDTEWRAAGQWGLTATDKSPEKAAQAAHAWSEVANDATQQAIGLAEQAIILDEAMGPLYKQKALAETRQGELLILQKALQEQLQSLSQAQADQPLDNGMRWRILGLTTRLATYSPTWISLLQEQPPPQAQPQEYTDWIEQLLAYIDSELSVLSQQIAGLDTRLTKMQQEYDTLYESSLGLSQNILIENTDFVEPYKIHNPSLIMLLGGLVGGCAWLFLQLIAIANRRSKDAAA